MSTSRRDPASKLAQELLEGDFRPAPLPADGIAQPAGGWEECSLSLDEPLFRRLKHLECSDAFIPAALMTVSCALLLLPFTPGRIRLWYASRYRAGRAAALSRCAYRPAPSAGWRS